MSDLRPDEPLEADLVRWGAATRRASVHRGGDVERLLAVAQAHQVRRRLAGAATAVAVLLVVFVGIAVAMPTTEYVDTAGPGPVSGTAPGATATVPGAPGWTVHPQVDHFQGDAWALRVTFDPAVWSLRAMVEDHVTPTGGAEFVGGASDDGVAYLYWVGDGAEATASSVRTALLDEPGILTVEIGLATQTNPPATGPVATDPPATGVGG